MLPGSNTLDVHARPVLLLLFLTLLPGSKCISTCLNAKMLIEEPFVDVTIPRVQQTALEEKLIPRRPQRRRTGSTCKNVLQMFSPRAIFWPQEQCWRKTLWVFFFCLFQYKVPLCEFFFKKQCLLLRGFTAAAVNRFGWLAN